MAITFRLRLGLTIAGTAVVAGLVAIGSWAWQRRLPSEVQTLQAVVERLSRSNDLGRQPIIFMMGSGEYSSFLAQQRGLCKPDQCEMFNQLNPYKHYGNGWDELTRQGYALSSIQAWTTPAGTVVLPRSTFRAYGPRIGYLACTVAHEIATSAAIMGSSSTIRRITSLNRSTSRKDSWLLGASPGSTS